MHQMWTVAVDDSVAWACVSLSVSKYVSPTRGRAYSVETIEARCVRRSDSVTDSMRPSPNYFGHMFVF